MSPYSSNLAYMSTVKFFSKRYCVICHRGNIRFFRCCYCSVCVLNFVSHSGFIYRIWAQRRFFFQFSFGIFQFFPLWRMCEFVCLCVWAVSSLARYMISSNHLSDLKYAQCRKLLDFRHFVSVNVCWCGFQSIFIAKATGFCFWSSNDDFGVSLNHYRTSPQTWKRWLNKIIIQSISTFRTRNLFIWSPITKMQTEETQTKKRSQSKLTRKMKSRQHTSHTFAVYFVWVFVGQQKWFTTKVFKSIERHTAAVAIAAAILLELNFPEMEENVSTSLLYTFALLICDSSFVCVRENELRKKRSLAICRLQLARTVLDIVYVTQSQWP